MRGEAREGEGDGQRLMSPVKTLLVLSVWPDDPLDTDPEGEMNRM